MVENATTERPGEWSFVKGFLPWSGGLKALPADVRMDGKTCLVTGANTGLGRCVAVDLGKRGANLIVICRQGHEKAVAEIEKEVGAAVVYLRCDLSEMKQVDMVCDEMKRRNIRLDVAVLNAGLMSPESKLTKEGFDIMFAVHVLANRLLVKRWIEDGVIQPRKDNESQPPRIVFVSSQSHLRAAEVDFSCIERYTPYTYFEALPIYGRSKLLLNMVFLELSRRLNQDVPPGQPPRVAVHALCPGAVNTDAARDPPAWFKPIIGTMFQLFFQSVEKGTRPIVLLSCGPEYGKRSGAYLFCMTECTPSDRATDEKSRKIVWERTGALITETLGDKSGSLAARL
ncbi:hypothetical protein DIPPA_64836 [Diplonema papillatum]|nr:hypothetical protein DIPPA_64836 [Diplonema papillatum]